MKRNTAIIIAIALLVAAVVVVVLTSYSSRNQMPGSDRDKHGCIGSAGYTWCDAKQKCLREWEEPCE